MFAFRLGKKCGSPSFCTTWHLELHRCVGNSLAHPSLDLLGLVWSHYKTGKAWLLHTSGLTLPKNLTHRLRFPSLLGVNMRQTSNSTQSPGATVNPAAARCRAELSQGYTAPSLGTSTPAQPSCHHSAPPELHSSLWHSITSTPQAYKDFFSLPRNSKNWFLRYSPREDAGEIKSPETESEFFSFPCRHTPSSPPAFLEPSVPSCTPAPLNAWVLLAQALVHGHWQGSPCAGPHQLGAGATEAPDPRSLWDLHCAQLNETQKWFVPS